MPITLNAKPAGAAYRYTWTVPLIEGDSIASAVLTVTGCVIDAQEISGADVIILVSGGTEGSTARIAAVVGTGEGETIVETIYLPIVSADATAMTVSDVVSFALRKVYGLGESPPDEAASDAIERLSDMLLLWKASGADVGATFPLSISTIIYCKPSYQSAVKNSLAVQISDQYGLQLSPVVATNAMRGLQLIRTENLPDDRDGPEYY